MVPRSLARATVRLTPLPTLPLKGGGGKLNTMSQLVFTELVRSVRLSRLLTQPLTLPRTNALRAFAYCINQP
jgi:hypothetical protein